MKPSSLTQGSSTSEDSKVKEKKCGLRIALEKCGLRIALDSGEFQEEYKEEIKFGNCPNDDNIYCMMCPIQLECMKVK